MLPGSTRLSPKSEAPPANSASSAATLPLPANHWVRGLSELHQEKKASASAGLLFLYFLNFLFALYIITQQ
jgi:hypothetical protein